MNGTDLSHQGLGVKLAETGELIEFSTFLHRLLLLLVLSLLHLI
jgi:hypothetical protein